MLIDRTYYNYQKYNKITFEEVENNDKDLKSVISFPVDVPLSKVIYMLSKSDWMCLRIRIWLIPNEYLYFNLKILNTVELVIPNSKHLVVGEPCHCVLVVRQSPYWNHKQQTEAIEFYYDVTVDFDNWLLSGQKKFCFSYKVGRTDSSMRFVFLFYHVTTFNY